MGPVTIDLTEKNLLELIKCGIEDLEARIDEKNTIMLISCAHIHDQYKALMYDRVRGIILSKKSTKVLIIEFLKKRAWMNILIVKACQRFLNKGGNCTMPYVEEAFSMIPLSGYTRKSTSWIFYSNNTTYTVLSEDSVGIRYEEIAGKCFIVSSKACFFKRIEQHTKRLSLERKKVLNELWKGEIAAGESHSNKVVAEIAIMIGQGYLGSTRDGHADILKFFKRSLTCLE